MRLFGRSPLAAEYRVCDTFCTALFDACKAGLYDGQPVVQTFPDAAALCAGLPLGGDIEVISTPLDATGRNCFVGRETEQRWYSLMFGEGMSGGIGFQPVQFTLDAVDGFGRDIEVGGDAVNVTVTGPNLFAVTPVDNDDGTYTVEYAAEIGGYYDIDARLQNSQLDLAPERVYVSQASLCPVQDGISAKPKPAPAMCQEFSENSCCTTEAHYRAVEQQQTEFNAMFKDAQCQALFDVASCGVACSPEQSLFYEPNANTTNVPTYAVCQSFCDQWYAACESTVINGGPMSSVFKTPADFCEASLGGERFAVLVRDELCFDGREPEVGCRNSYANGDGLYNWLTGDAPSELRIDEQYTFNIQAVDIYQNLRLDDATEWQVEFDVGGVVPQATALGDGVTQISWSTTKAGDMSVSVTCDGGEHIEHSPFPIYVRPGDYADVELDCPKQARADKRVVVDVWAVDKYRNRLDQSPGDEVASRLRIEVRGPNGFSATPLLVDNCDGSFSAFFLPQGSGEYEVILYDDAQSDNERDTCSIPVRGATQPPTPAPAGLGPCYNTSTLEGAGLAPLDPMAGAAEVLAQRQFRIITRDAEGRPSGVSTAQFRIDFYIDDPEAGLLNLRNPANARPGTPEAMLAEQTFNDLVPVLVVEPVAGEPGNYTVTYRTRIASDLVIYVVLLPESDGCGGVIEKRVIKGNCPRPCIVGGVCVYESASSTETVCQCLEPAYKPCPSYDPQQYPDLPPNLACCPAAPYITGIRFADEPSTSIIVDFSTETDQAGMEGTSNCSTLISIDEEDAGVGPLGDNSYCVWKNQSSLILWFGADATVSIGDEIILAKNVLYSDRFPGEPAVPVQNVREIAAPNVRPLPRVQISGPETFNPCTAFRLDASFSSGTGGRNMLYNWTLLTPSAGRTGDQLKLVEDFNAFLATQSGPTLVLPSGLNAQLGTVGAGRTFQVSAIATNHFGDRTAAPGTFTFKVDLDSAAPQVRIIPPGASITRSKALKLAAAVTRLSRDPAAGCDAVIVPDDRELEYVWRQVGGPAFDLGVTTLNTLYIAPNALLPNERYTFELTAAFKVRPTLSATAHVTVDVLPSELIAQLIGGDRLFPLSAGGKPLVFDASQSYDPDELGRPLQYRWSIRSLVDNAPLLDASQEASLLNPGGNGLATVTLPVDVLRAGEWVVRLVLTAELDPFRRSSVTSALVTIVDRGAPIVTIDGPPEGLFNPDQRLALRGFVDADPADGDVQLQWRSTQGLFDFEKHAADVSTSVTSPNLVVRPDVFGSGAVFTFRLEATNDAGVGFAEYTVEANAQPNAGSCSIDRTTGQALLDEFTVTCRKFEDKFQQLPIAYRAYRRPVGATDDTQDFPLNVAPTNAPTMTFRMFQGEYNIVIYVSDSLGMAQEYVLPETVTVTRSGSNSQLLAALEQELRDAEGNSDADKFLNAADILAQILKLEAERAKQNAATPAPRKRQIIEDDEDADPPVEESRLNRLRNELVLAITRAFVTELSPATTDTKLELLSEALSSGAVELDTYVAVVEWLDEVATASFPLGITRRTPGNTIRLAGAVIADAPIELFDDAPNTDALRDAIDTLSTVSLRLVLPGESAWQEQFTRATDDDQPDLVWAVQKTSSSAPTTVLRGPGSRFTLPGELFENLLESGAVEQREVGFEQLSIRRQIYRWAIGAARIRSLYAINELSLFDANGEQLEVDEAALGDTALQFSLTLQPELEELLADTDIASTRGVCAYFDGGAFSESGCRSTSHDYSVVNCECTHLSDYAGGVVGAQLPPGSPPLRERAAQLQDGGFADNYLWLLLLLLLLLYCTLCIVGCLVLYHRKRDDEQDGDTLQPYLDKAAGMGALAAIGGGDVSDSSELERRDYPLPVGVYQIPERTEDSDLNRSDFSWALEGESEALARGDSSDSASELGHATGDTYKEGRLAKMAGGTAGATSTTREQFTTEYDLDRTADEPRQAVAPGTAELARPSTAAGTKATRD